VHAPRVSIISLRFVSASAAFESKPEVMLAGSGR
jgi:hypothetical protein